MRIGRLSGFGVVDKAGLMREMAARNALPAPTVRPSISADLPVIVTEGGSVVPVTRQVSIAPPLSTEGGAGTAKPAEASVEVPFYKQSWFLPAALGGALVLAGGAYFMFRRKEA